MNAINIPQDVSWVWAIKYSRVAVGIETYNRIEEIIKEYPEFFPWENKYASIPNCVHEAYRNEKYPPWGGIIKKGKNGKGIWELMQEKPKRRRKTKCIDIRQVIQEMFEHQEKCRRKEERQKKKDRKLWDKYYKPYRLEYRD